MTKKKKIIIIVISLLIVTFIFLGIIHNNEPFTFTKSLFFEKSSRTEIYNEEFTEIDTIYVDVDNAIINLKNSEADNIKVEIYSERDNIRLKSYNKKLSIMTEDRKKCMFCTLNVINIYAKEDFREYINIINDHGHTNLDNFPNASVSIVNKFGNVEVGNINMLKVVLGRGKFVGDTINGASIRSDWGDIDIKEVNDIIIDDKFTDINISKVNSSIKLTNDIGNISIKNANIIKESKIKNDFGDMNIDNLIDLEGNLK